MDGGGHAKAQRVEGKGGPQMTQSDADDGRASEELKKENAQLRAVCKRFAAYRASLRDLDYIEEGFAAKDAGLKPLCDDPEIFGYTSALSGKYESEESDFSLVRLPFDEMLEYLGGESRKDERRGERGSEAEHKPCPYCGDDGGGGSQMRQLGA